MAEKHSSLGESTEKQFNDLIQRASLAIHYDPDLSPAAKFGLSKEVLGIGRLSQHLDNWQAKDTQQLLAHLANIYQLSPVILDIMLQGLNQSPVLLPEGIDRQFLENQRKLAAITL